MLIFHPVLKIQSLPESQDNDLTESALLMQFPAENWKLGKNNSKSEK
jgi:hypothetical protein